MEKTDMDLLNNNPALYFGEEMLDGRLTEETDNKRYHFRAMIKKRTELGRPLSNIEMQEFAF